MQKNPPVSKESVRVLFPTNSNSLEMVDFLTENGYTFERSDDYFVFVTDNMISAREALFLFNGGVLA